MLPRCRVDAVDVEIAEDAFIAAGAEQDVDALETVVELAAEVLLVDQGLPVGVFAVGVHQREGVFILQEVFVADG